MTKYMRFDWAMKRLLRDKANFGVLEGLITTLLGKKIHINKLLESESNKDREDQKANRVDLLAEDERGVLYLIEVQNESEVAYFQRMLFGASKLLTEYINSGQGYENVSKVYSINIVYFNLGQGKDVVYHGKTEFRGIHDGDILQLTPFQCQKFKADAVSDLYPEYFILKANDFNRWSKVPLDQWIYFLSTGDIPDDADAPGLDMAREKMKVASMTKEELAAYRRHLDDAVIMRDVITTAWEESRFMGHAEGHAEGLAEGRAEGRAKGRAEGWAEGRAETARKMKADNMPVELISKYTGLTAEEIEQL